jgi:hypothetical protein
MKIMILLLVVVSFFWERMIPKTASHPFKNIRTSQYLNIEKEQWEKVDFCILDPPPNSDDKIDYLCSPFGWYSIPLSPTTSPASLTLALHWRAKGG